MIWDTLPIANNEAADVVVGQVDFTTDSCSTSDTELCYPAGAWSDGTKLIISDSGNCRALIWNTFPAANNAAADVVVGQSDFTSANCGATSTLLNGGDSLWTDGTSLVIPDTYKHRTLIWNKIPTTDNNPADKVVGQEDFTTATSGGGLTKLYNPTQIKKIKDHYYILDSYNSRVLAIHKDLF